MSRDKVLGMLGLAARAGKVVSGEFSVEKQIRSGASKLVIVAADASDNTRKLFNDKCSFYKVPIYIYSNKEELGTAIGRQSRASVSVSDAGFADALKECIRRNNQEV